MENLAGIFLLGLRFSLAIILFIFLFWSIKIIWKDFTTTAQVKTTNKIPQILFSEVAEEYQTHSFMIEEIIIGREPTCDLQISDDTVSSKHARVFFENNQWWVEDLGSSNGSYLNEMLVSTPTVLTIGDLLRFGKIKIEINITHDQLQGG